MPIRAKVACMHLNHPKSKRNWWFWTNQLVRPGDLVEVTVSDPKHASQVIVKQIGEAPEEYEPTQEIVRVLAHAGDFSVDTKTHEVEIHVPA